MNEYGYYYEQYRNAPRNSATTQKDLADYHSTASTSTYNIWTGATCTKQLVTATCIDGNKLLGLRERPCSIKDSFPKGKSRRKSSIPCEKKINTGDVFISLAPAEKITADAVSARSEKTRSPLSMATGTQGSTLPDVQIKSANTRNNRMYSATIFDNENSEAKFYGRCATTYASGAWVRRYKSINESQALTDLLRDHGQRDKALLKKRSCHQLFHSSSLASTLTSTLIKRTRAKC